MAKHYTKLIIAINENINSIVTAVKGDVASRFLDVQLYSNGVPIDLTKHTVTMSAKSHPDSNFKVPIDKFIDGVITDATNGRCQFELKTDIIGQTGVLILQISIFSGQQEVLSTNPFNLYVIDGLRNDEQIEASNEFGALVVLFSEIQNALDDMNAIRENFGEPSQESIEQGILTFWGIIEQMRKDVASAVAYDLPEKIGEPNDEETSNTMFGKVNWVKNFLSASVGGEKVFDSPGGFSFQIPDHVYKVEIIAAGGGGGGERGSAGSGGGYGGSGGECVSVEKPVNPGDTISGNIGSGGASQHNGTPTVVNDIITAKGGICFDGVSAGSGSGAGGQGGQYNNRKAQDGSKGLYGVGGKAGGTDQDRHGGGGGGSYGNGGDGGTYNVAGKNGTHGGGGGGGGQDKNGGTGGNGIVVIRWGLKIGSGK